MNQTKFGMEWKDALPDLASAETLEQWERIVLSFEPIALGIAFWHCRRPWGIPTRRIGDNLLYFVASGMETFTVGDETKIMKRGDLAVVPEFTPHSFGLADGCLEGSHFMIHALAEAPVGENPFASFVTPFPRLEFPEAWLETLGHIVALRNRSRAAATSWLRRQLRALLLEQAAKGAYRLPEKGCRDERVHGALTFIRNNYAGSIAVADIAESVHLHEAQLRVLFRNALGLSPGACLQRERLAHAARMLARYDRNMAEIASLTGFANESYFCTAFRRAFGHSPGEYRTLVRRG